MAYSFTQIANYLRCPRSYRHRYLDGWRETWLHKAKELPKEGFKCAVEWHLTGKEAEPWEILYFKVYKSQLAVVEKALETAGLMLGTDNLVVIAWR
jgi:hypothetical protein